METPQISTQRLDHLGFATGGGLTPSIIGSGVTF
jgi:hypothetical protein